MASIQTGIELNDQFSGILNNIISSVNLAVAAMYDMQESMNADIGTSSLDGAREGINQATAAIQAMNEALNSQSSPDVSPPAVEQPPPVEIPVVWQTDGVEVFTGSGMDRYRQEAQSANAMLEQLSATQNAIARQAFDTNILPPEAFRNLNTMAVRIDSIRDRVQQIENNPLNMGTDTANAELEQLRAQLNQALQIQAQLNQAVGDMDAQAANEAYLRLSQIIGNTERHIRDNVDEQGRFRREIEGSTGSAAGLKNMIASAVGAFAGMAGLKKAKEWIEECTAAFDTQRNAELQLISVLANILDTDYVSQSTVETEVIADTSEAAEGFSDIQNQTGDVTISASADTQALTAAFDTITAKASEIQSRGIYGDEAMIAGAAEFSTYFSDTAAIEMMMDTLADYAMGMSGGGEIDSTAMVEYATGLGKIMSGSYDAMTKKGFEFTEAQKAVIDGTATQEQVIAAIGDEYLNASQDVQAAAAINAVIAESWDGLYESMSNTPEGKIIQMKNTFGDMKEVVGGQLYPYVILLVDAITSNWDTIQTILDSITMGLQIMMGILSWLLEGALGFAQGVIDNWSWISPIIYGIVAALTAYTVISGIVAIINGVHTASEAAKAAAQAMATGATFAETAAQYGLNAALAACPLTWIIILIIALIVVIFVVCNAIAKMTGVADSGFGVICGCLNVANEFFKNLGLTVANIALGIWNAIGALTDNMKIAFNNAICSVQSKWYALLSTVLSVVADICEALNKLPFVEIDSGFIDASRDAADIYAAKALEAEGNKEEFKSVSDAFNEGFHTYETFQDGWVSEAFEAGVALGDGIADLFGSFSLKDLFSTEQTPDTDDLAEQLAAEGIGGGVGDIAENTGSIKDSLDCTEEDLKYLRDIAEQEAVNRYTLAEVKVEQTNHNSINSGMDLDGVVSGLTDAVNESIASITEGVHG